jgi:hypothetical protein
LEFGVILLEERTLCQKNTANQISKNKENSIKSDDSSCKKLEILTKKILKSTEKESILIILEELLSENCKLDIKELVNRIKEEKLKSEKKGESQKKEESEGTEFSNDFESIDTNDDLSTSKEYQSPIQAKPEKRTKNHSVEISKKLENLKQKTINKQNDRSKSVRYSQGINRRILNSKSCLVSRKSNKMRKFSENKSKKKSNTIHEKPKKNQSEVKFKTQKILNSKKKNESKAESNEKKKVNQKEDLTKNFFENELQMAMNDIYDVEKRLHKIQPINKSENNPSIKPNVVKPISPKEGYQGTIREKSRKKIRQILKKNIDSSRFSNSKLLNQKQGKIYELREEEEDNLICEETDLPMNDESSKFASLDPCHRANLSDLANSKKIEFKENFDYNQSEYSKAIRESFKLSMLDSQMIRKSRDIRSHLKQLKPKIELQSVSNEKNGQMQTPDPCILKIHKEAIPNFQDLKLEKSKMLEEAYQSHGKELKSLRSLETHGSMYQSLNSANLINESIRGLSKNYIDSRLIRKIAKNEKLSSQPTYNFKIKKNNTPRNMKKSNVELEKLNQTKEKEIKKIQEVKSSETHKSKSKSFKNCDFENSVFGSQNSIRQLGSVNYSKHKRKSNLSVRKSHEKNARNSSKFKQEKSLFGNFRKYVRKSSHKKKTGSVKIHLNRKIV